MKILISNGSGKIEANLKFVESKPLIKIDDNLLEKTTIVDNTTITGLGINLTTGLEYKLKSAGEDESDTIVNVGTVPHYFSKGSMDLIYIPLHKVLALVPNLASAIVSESGLLDIEAISIGGVIQSDSCYPNVSVTHDDRNSQIDLGEDFTGVSIKTQLNNIYGGIKSNNANPTLQTDYLTGGIGEILIGESTPMLNITLEVTAVPAFKNDNYPASVLYPVSVDRFKLKHLETTPKADKYMVVIG